MDRIFIAVAALLSTDPEMRTREICDDDRCHQVTVLTEDDGGAALFWFSLPYYEKFRLEVVEPVATRCRHDDLLVVFGDRFVPEGVAGTTTSLGEVRKKSLETEVLVTMQQYERVGQFHGVWGHEYGHYLHEQYCLTI
ncbi:MAG: hypothetical protein QGG40_04805, partial [Myxococcota bacterium]|nr:hypothetical protein [Myxococcota bacterium]